MGRGLLAVGGVTAYQGNDAAGLGDRPALGHGPELPTGRQQVKSCTMGEKPDTRCRIKGFQFVNHAPSRDEAKVTVHHGR